MSLSSPFIRRPVGTTLLTIAIALAGVVSFLFLPMAPLPQVDYPTISVGASLPGASPEIMASSVATPLERQFGRIAGITEMTSSSGLGSTNITMQFDLNRNIDGAARDVQAAINAARSYLPANLPSNPRYRKVNPSDSPILILALTSKIYDTAAMYDAASTVLAQGLSQVDGVGQVSVGGASLPAVRVDVNPTQLNSYGLGLATIATMLRAQNANLPKGQIANDRMTADILANDQLLKANQYKPLIVGFHKGAAIKLSDVANVTDSVENIRAGGYVNGEPSVSVIVFRQPGANIIDTVDAVRAAMPALKASIPAGINLTTVVDRTTTIRASVDDVELTLVISIVLVIMVVFVFLRNARATFIPSIVVPVSLLGTFGIMYLGGYTIDNLSLMALTISTGFVVDDAIVVIENITRYIEMGYGALEAAFKGAQEISFTVVAMSTSLVAVFIPILLMGGIIGRLFREFAITLSGAIFMSMCISLTATPMMCSRLLRHESQEGHNIFYRASERTFNWLLRVYERTLTVVLQHPAFTLGILIVTIGVNIYLLDIVPKGFFPEQDNGTIGGGIEGAQDSSFVAMNKLTQQFVRIIKADPAVENVFAFTGGQGATNHGFVYMGLKPLSERKMSALQVVNRLRPKLNAVPGATVFLQPGQDLRIGGRMSNAQFQYTIQSDNVDDLVKWGPLLVQGLKKVPEFTDVNSDQQNSGLQATLTYNRMNAARLGITPQAIDNTLYQAFGQSIASTMYTALNQYYVVMEVAPQFWQSPAGLKNVYLNPKQGAEVPLNAVAQYQTKTAALSVNHQGQFPSVTVSFNLAPGVALGDGAALVNEVQRKLGMPPSIRGMFSGALQAFQTSLSTEPFL
ncbi:MAG TPA: efflux RND transporter permease subunit, partial [Nitrospira sp.]|nr:efflux RND transporter permease subunit [Nitrospira sp.]